MATLSLGKRIRTLREAKNLKQQQLARLCHMDPGQLSRYEADEMKPGYDALRALAFALEVRVGYLFGEIPELEELQPWEVATRESLLTFLTNVPAGERRAQRFRNMVEAPTAPRTVQAWRNLEELILLGLGKKQ